jgi:hypothetical protein
MGVGVGCSPLARPLGGVWRSASGAPLRSIRTVVPSRCVAVTWAGFQGRREAQDTKNYEGAAEGAAVPQRLVLGHYCSPHAVR